ncbi:MAG TPA: hypothetical protein DCE56_11055 [Cyanobacteria bacterium UBA8553]|nr:hypothetical protein [Cyanobacteria bacterium UBA8553]HAJ63674.1 hypothetical protein [Cyanobacteria bacterium UBA8543]
MAENFSGRVLFANGSPAQSVLVRVFDKDEPGKGDDDLTVEPGRSDSEGRFTVCFEPSLYLDYNTISTQEPSNSPWNWTLNTRTRPIPDITDIYLPYVEFRYTFNGRRCVHTAFMVPFQTEFRLPEIPAFDFKPCVHGFKFVNKFSGYPLPISVPNLPNLSAVESSYGLCGGMSSAAYDFLAADRSIPLHTTAPAVGSTLHQYLYRRQIDTFGSFGEYIAKFAQWMVLPDDTIFGIQKRTYDEFEEIRAKLDDGNPVVLGLVYVSSRETIEIWNNHQVLAYGYSEVSDSTIDVNIYDPNYPGRDDVTIRVERVPVGTTFVPGVPPRKRTVLGFRCTQKMSNHDIKVRGFFAMPYAPVMPPAEL